MSRSQEHPFYDQEIVARDQQKYIESILTPFRGMAANDELKKLIWDELQKAKYEGRITIPFKVVSRRDIYHRYPEYIEVILDTKV